jgi:lipopolysaccharide export system protein LptA
MTCRDNVQVLDPETGRQVMGDSAVYTVADRRVEVYGASVLLIDSQNNRLEGQYLLYDLDAGTVNIQSRAPVQGRP